MSDRERMAVRLIDAAETVYDVFLRAILLFVMGISLFCLYDTYSIYDEASSGSLYSRYRPVSDGSSDLSFSSLVEKNPDVRAWISIDGTDIDYPVVQGKDNSWYLNRNVLGGYSLSGSIFLDAANSPGFSDRYSLLYGHHMDYGAMFGSLDSFADPAYLSGHTTGKLWLSDRCYVELYVTATLVTDAYDSRVFDVSAQKDSQELYELVMDEAVCTCGVLTSSDRLLGLSTCTGSGTSERTVVFCRMGNLKEVGEDGSQDH